MKKIKSVFGVAAVAAAAVSLAACGGSSEYGDSTKNTEVPAKDYQAFYENTARVYRDYVKVGDYNGLEVAKVDRSTEEITDETVESTLESLAQEYRNEEDVTNGGTTQEGDEIVLDFTGSIDGKEFDGGSSTDYSYTVGSGNFIDDLDKGLVGKEAGKDYDINVKFPDDYGNEELNGKDAVFKVNIKSITRPTNAEINDEFVAAHTDDWELKGYGSGIKTVDALKEGIKKSLAESKKATNDQTLYGEALEKLLETSEFKDELPQEELNYLADTMKSNVKNQFESYGESMGIESYEDYIKQYYGYESEEEFDKYVQTQAEDYLKSKMITTIIAADNGVKVSAEDITKEGNATALYYGYDSYQKLVETYGQILNAETGYQVLYGKVSEIVANAVNQVEETSSSAEAESGESTENSGSGSTEEETTTAQ